MSDCQVLSPGTSHYTDKLELLAYRDRIPYKGVFELTARCNFNCKMCYVHLSEQQIRERGRELTNEQWLRLARQARDAGMLHLNLTGGEVFARPHFRELYESLSQLGFLLQIQSNGYLIDEETIGWLGQCPPYAMRFTLYGTSNSVYEAVCGVKDGFDRVDHAIDLVCGAGIPLYLVGTVIRENEADLEAMYRYAREKKLPFTHTYSVVHAVRGATADVDRHRITLDDLPKEETEKIQKVERFYPRYDHFLDVCGSYRRGFWLTWDGRLQLCSFMEHPSVSVEDQPFLDAWRQLLEEIEALRAPKECADCRYEGFCQHCPGVLCAECGAPDRVTPEFCNQAKILYRVYHDDTK